MAMRPRSLRSLRLEQTLIDRTRESIEKGDIEEIEAVLGDSDEYTEALKNSGDIQGALEA